MSKLTYKEFEGNFLGLLPDDFKRFLISKVNVLLKSVFWQPKVPLSRKEYFSEVGLKAVEQCVKKICIRPKITNQEELDKRYTRSSRLYTAVVNDTIRDTKASPSVLESITDKFQNMQTTDDSDIGDDQFLQVTSPVHMSPIGTERATSRKQGTKRHHKVLNDTYHKHEVQIFKLLAELICELGYPPLKLEDLPGDDHTETFCTKIDFYTTAIFRCCVYSICNPQQYPNIKCMNIFIAIVEVCLKIVMQRHIVDFQRPNNLLAEQGWLNWRKHVIVLISFAALCTSLLMLAKLITRKISKFKFYLRTLKTESCYTDEDLKEILELFDLKLEKYI